MMIKPGELRVLDTDPKAKCVAVLSEVDIQTDGKVIFNSTNNYGFFTYYTYNSKQALMEDLVHSVGAWYLTIVDNGTIEKYGIGITAKERFMATLALLLYDKKPEWK